MGFFQSISLYEILVLLFAPGAATSLSVEQASCISNLIWLYPVLVPVHFKDFSSLGTIQPGSLTGSVCSESFLWPAVVSLPLRCLALQALLWMSAGGYSLILPRKHYWIPSPNQVIREVVKDNCVIIIRIVPVSWYFSAKTRERMGKRFPSSSPFASPLKDSRCWTDKMTDDSTS